jgi:DNA polymerase/3'-5' exonuclease PolX
MSVDTNILSVNKDLADILSLLASYYVMAGDTYRAGAFTKASNKIADYDKVILSGAQARNELSGVGASTESIIDEYISTGKVQRLIDLETQFNEQKHVIDYFRSFYGIGPVTAVNFYNQGFRTLEDLWYKANLTDAQKIGIIWREHMELRIPREEMNLINNKLLEYLSPYSINFTIAGSYRRGELSSGDIDVLVESRSDIDMETLVALLEPILPATLALGPTVYRGIIRLSDQHPGHRIDIRLIPKENWYPALMYFTGSQYFNILMRQRAIELGYTLNEYGLYKNNIAQTINSEEDIFRILRVTYISPTERTKQIHSLTYF